MKLDRELWRNGVIKSKYERVSHEVSSSIDGSLEQTSQAEIEAALAKDPQLLKHRRAGHQEQRVAVLAEHRRQGCLAHQKAAAEQRWCRSE